jgi:hypothetical protein
MEVHAHSHTVPIAIGRKKWTHYLWEFLMLFLAVFCGFLAENVREHMIEHQREKQFMKSLLYDLKADTTQLNSLQKFRRERMMQLDTLMSLLKSPQLKENTSLFYYDAVLSQYNAKFLPHNGALSQLKNAGGLRLIRKGNIIDSILHFDTKAQEIVDFENWERERMIDLTAFNKVVDASIVEQNSKYTYPEWPYAYQRATGNPPLLSYDKHDLDQLYNRFQLQKRMHAVVITDMYGLNKIIVSLIDLLEQEYHLK